MDTVRAAKPHRSVSRNAKTLRITRAVTLADEQVVVPVSAHSLEGYRQWAKSEAFPDHGHIFFLGSEIYIDMSPEELENHAKVKLEIARVLANLNRKEKLGEFYPDGSLLTNIEANLSTEPDGTFATWERLESRRLRLVPRGGAQGEFMELEGSPDWVLEIISKYSVQKDTETLRKQYYRAHVSEYWLVDARHEAIDFTILLRGERDYVPTTQRAGWQSSKVFGRSFRLVRRRGRMNLWQYTLQMKSSGQ